MVEEAKKHIFEHFRNDGRDLITNYLSTWFFEFNHLAKSSMSDFTLHLLESITTSEDNTRLNISLLFRVYSNGCRLLVSEDRDTLRIFDIIDSVTKSIVCLLEKGVNLEGLSILLALAQITFHYIKTDLTYPAWFENTFFSPKTSQLTKKMYIIFIKRLREITPYEIPTVLQIHGKILLQANKEPEFVTLVKTRLLELGVDNSLKKHPTEFQTPVQRITSSSILPTAIQDEVALAVEQFAKKEGTIPTGLLQNYVFRRQWFLATFLPALFSWEPVNSDLKNAKINLIQALKEKGKIPDTFYKKWMKR